MAVRPHWMFDYSLMIICLSVSILTIFSALISYARHVALCFFGNSGFINNIGDSQAISKASMELPEMLRLGGCLLHIPPNDSVPGLIPASDFCRSFPPPSVSCQPLSALLLNKGKSAQK